MKTDAKYSIKNPMVTSEDITDHDAVAAVIRDRNMVLVFWHKKYQVVTLPVGKVKEGQSLREALNEEIKEEIGIEIIQCHKIFSFAEDYARGDGIVTHTNQHVFEITEYTGTIVNAEPDKHDQLTFMRVGDLASLELAKSDVLSEFVKWSFGRVP